MSRTFWDTNIFIYLLERDSKWYGAARRALTEAFTEGGLVTSALTLGELLAKPLREGRRDLTERYEDFFLWNMERVSVVPFTRELARGFASIRASTRVQPPDAIQLACALAGGARLFVTNDRKLWSLRIDGLDSIRGL